MIGKVGALSIVLALASCLGAPPPPPPRPAPPPPPPPPAGPKCESLVEACTSVEGTHVPIQDSGWTIHPPNGWKYAQEPVSTIAETDHAALVLVVEPVREGTHAAYRNVVERAALRLDVHGPKTMFDLPKKPDEVITVGSLRVSLRQVDHAKRKGKGGALLIFWTLLPGARDLAGMGFVADADDSKADERILDALSSIARVQPPSAESSEAHAEGAADGGPR